MTRKAKATYYRMIIIVVVITLMITVRAFRLAHPLAYTNAEYGFSFYLPATWEGYQVINSQWEGLAINGSFNQAVAAHGPQIILRHPGWTDQEPRQDIPLLVFTHTQWDALVREEFHIGAAPIGPRELGRNNLYVLALPARYNYAFPEGYEEVEAILDSNPLHLRNVSSTER